jgi:hypothetical protein
MAVAFVSANGFSGVGPTVALPAPASLAQGNSLIAFLTNRTGSTITDLASSDGFTRVGSELNTSTNLKTSVWVLPNMSSGDAAKTTFSWTYTGTAAMSGNILQLSGTATTAAGMIADHDTNEQASGGSSVPTTSTNAVANGLLCVFAATAHETTAVTAHASSSPLTERDERGGGAGQFAWRRCSAHTDTPAAGATSAHTISITGGPAGITHGWQVAVAPPASGWSGRTAPDAIGSLIGLTGAVTDVDDDPDSPDANWLVVS